MEGAEGPEPAFSAPLEFECTTDTNTRATTGRLTQVLLPQEEHDITYVDKGEKPETNHEDSKTNPNCGTFYEHRPGCFLFLKLKIIAVKDKDRNCSTIKATKEVGWLIVLYNLGWLWTGE